MSTEIPCNPNEQQDERITKNECPLSAGIHIDQWLA